LGEGFGQEKLNKERLRAWREMFNAQCSMLRLEVKAG
jgi:hypothetical protein